MMQQEKKWILGRMADELIKHTPQGVTCKVTDRPSDNPGDINFYNPYRTYERNTCGIDVVFCTHPEIQKFYDVAKKADHVIVMNTMYRNILSTTEPGKVTCIFPGVDDCYRDEKLHIFQPIDKGRGERKGLTLWNRLQAVPWLDCDCPNGKYTKEQMVMAYRASDAVVSTSTNAHGGEGGPMLIPEGIAMGCTVVAPYGVGLAGDIEGVITYKDGDYDDLLRVLQSLHEAKQKRQAAVIDFTWKRWAEQHFECFARLLNHKRPQTVEGTSNFA
jgi:glycosyltransferase involved in cell wall biosynthesis